MNDIILRKLYLLVSIRISFVAIVVVFLQRIILMCLKTVFLSFILAFLLADIYLASSSSSLSLSFSFLFWFYISNHVENNRHNQQQQIIMTAVALLTLKSYYIGVWLLLSWWIYILLSEAILYVHLYCFCLLVYWYKCIKLGTKIKFRNERLNKWKNAKWNASNFLSFLIG